MTDRVTDRCIGTLLGLACGDVLYFRLEGVPLVEWPVEIEQRDANGRTA